jgi:hypothetical protein
VRELGAIALLASQNLDAVLRVMQWGVIALIFLFFLRVVRAVWVEMSPATIRKPRAARRQERAANDRRRDASSSTCAWSSRPNAPVRRSTSMTS